MTHKEDTPYRGKEFDPCGQKAASVAGSDVDYSDADINLDREDGQIEGVFASSLGREASTLTSDQETAEYIARDGEIARQEILDEEAKDQQ